MSLPVLWAIIRVLILEMPLVARLLQLAGVHLERAKALTKEDEENSSIPHNVHPIRKQPFLAQFKYVKPTDILLMESQLHEGVYLKKIKKKAPCRAGPFNST